MSTLYSSFQQFTEKANAAWNRSAYPPTQTQQPVVASTTTDLSINAQTYGKIIPLGFGLRRVLGQVIASSPIAPGSKKVTFAVSFGYSGFQERARVLRRIWAGDNMSLIYDASATPVKTPAGVTLRFYGGGEAQVADPDLLAMHADTPAYRQHCYLVIKDLDTSSYGYALPPIIAEIVENNSADAQAAIFDGAFTAASDLAAAGLANWLPDWSGRRIYALQDGDTLASWDVAGRALIDTQTITGLPSGTTALTLAHYLSALSQILAVAETPGGDHLVLIDPSTAAVSYDGGVQTHAWTACNSEAEGTRASANVAYDGGGSPVQIVCGARVDSAADGGAFVWEITASSITLAHRSDSSGRGQGEWFSGTAWAPFNESGVAVDYPRFFAFAGRSTSGYADFYFAVRYVRTDIPGDDGSRGYIHRVRCYANSDPPEAQQVKFYAHSDYDGVSGTIGPEWAAYDGLNDRVLYGEKEGTSIGMHLWNSATISVVGDWTIPTAPALSLAPFGVSDWQHNGSQLLIPQSDGTKVLAILYATGAYRTMEYPDAIDTTDAPLIYDGSSGDIIAAKESTYGPWVLSEGIDPGVRIPLSDVILGTAYAMGYGEDEIEVVGVSDLVTGALYADNISFRQFIDDICGAFALRKKQGEKLTIRRRDAPFAADMTLAADELVVKGGASFTLTRAEEASIPNQVEVQYLDEDQDYMASTMIARRPAYPVETSRSFQALTYAPPIVLSGGEAAGLAAKALYQAWAERTGYALRAMPRAIALEPVDVVTFTTGGRTFTGIVVEATIGADLSVDLKLTATWDARSIAIDRDDPTVVDPILDGPTSPAFTETLLDDADATLLDDSSAPLYAD